MTRKLGMTLLWSNRGIQLWTNITWVTLFKPPCLCLTVDQRLVIVFNAMKDITNQSTWQRYHSLDQATHVTPGPPPTTRPVPTPAAGSSSSSQHPTDQTHDTHTTAHQQPSSQHDSDDMSDDYSPRAPSPPLPSTSRSIHPTSTSITNNTTEHHHDEEDDEDDDDEIFSTPLIPASQNPNPSSSTAAATSTLPAATKNNDISNPEATQLPPLPMNSMHIILLSFSWLFVSICINLLLFV